MLIQKQRWFIQYYYFLDERCSNNIFLTHLDDFIYFGDGKIPLPLCNHNIYLVNDLFHNK